MVNGVELEDGEASWGVWGVADAGGPSRSDLEEAKTLWSEVGLGLVERLGLGLVVISHPPGQSWVYISIFKGCTNL